MSEQLRDLPLGYLHGRQVFWRAHVAAALGQREVAVPMLRDAYAMGFQMEDDYDVLPHADRDFADFCTIPPFWE